MLSWWMIITISLFLYDWQADGVDITANSLHPGLIATNITNNLNLVGCKYFSLCQLTLDIYWFISILFSCFLALLQGCSLPSASSFSKMLPRFYFSFAFVIHILCNFLSTIMPKSLFFDVAYAKLIHELIWISFPIGSSNYMLCRIASSSWRG